jgi:hypothetical protein
MMILIFLLAIIGGFLSGFIGLGGAVVMIPLMLTIPPLFGFEPLTMKTVAGLSMMQVLFASLSGIVIHKKNHFVHLKTLFTIGFPMGLFSLAGSYFSKFMDDRLVLMLFGSLIIVSFILLVTDKSKRDFSLEEVKVNYSLSVLIGSVIGFLAGVVGAGGGFILIPLMIMVLKIPLKITVGTSLGVVFIGAFFGSIGKILSFQVDFLLVIPVVTGSLLGAPFGAHFSKKSSPAMIKGVLFAVIIFSWLQVGFKLFR